MANTNNLFSDYVRFYLINENLTSIEVSNLIGWENFGYDAARNMDYHGTINKVTKSLGFTGDEKDFILNEYKINKTLTKIGLIRLRLKEVNDEVVWVQDDPVWADFEKLDIKDNVLNINFYSNSLMNLVESHEEDEFEVERLETIDNVAIKPLEKHYVEIKGRSLQAIGESKLINGYSISQNDRVGTHWAISTELISEGPTRHSEQLQGVSNVQYPLEWTALNMFYDNSTTEDLVKTVTISLDSSNAQNDGIYLASSKTSGFYIYKFQYDENNAEYNLIDKILLHQGTIVPGYDAANYYQEGFEENFRKTVSIEVEYNQALQIGWETSDNAAAGFNANGCKLLLSEVAFFEPSPSIRFNFYYDVVERLMYILTGRKDSFISSWLGRKEKGYDEDGWGGLIGFVSGLWMRDFKPDSDRYKSPKISLKDSLESIANCFNLGYGVEVINNVSKLVLEHISYFYRDEVVGEFPTQTNNYNFKVDPSSLYSRLEFGYEKGGELEQRMGLDEPNIKSQYITPLNNSRNKFIKISKVRSDEYKLEELRRKPQSSNPNESLSGDEDNWFIDLKRSQDIDVDYEQVQWQDRLEEEPTGIHDPDSFRSMIFTPRAILFRMASNFKSGIYSFKYKFINFISSSSNRDLSMRFLNENTAYKESDNFKINDLDRPIFKSEIVTFTHPWTDEVEELIFGKTEIVINGQKRFVPNYLFKIGFKDDKGETQRGYYLKHEFEDNPTFTFQLANEEII